MSVELRSFLTGLGIATSRTTPYHPQGNSQCERLNGTIWRAVQLSMESKKLSRGLWDTVLPDVLHLIRSLLCTATNATPHERMFSFQRRSATGTSLPSWLVNPGKVLLKNTSEERPTCQSNQSNSWRRTRTTHTCAIPAARSTQSLCEISPPAAHPATT